MGGGNGQQGGGQVPQQQVPPWAQQPQQPNKVYSESMRDPNRPWGHPGWREEVFQPRPGWVNTGPGEFTRQDPTTGMTEYKSEHYKPQAPLWSDSPGTTPEQWADYNNQIARQQERGSKEMIIPPDRGPGGPRLYQQPQQPNVTDFIRAGQQAPQQGKGMQRFMNRNIDPRERAAFQSMPIQQQRQARRDLRQERRQGRRLHGELQRAVARGPDMGSAGLGDAPGKGGGIGSRQPVVRGFARGGTPWRGDAIAQNRANIAAGITPVGTPWNQNPDLVGGFLGSRLGTPAAPNQVNAFMGGATGWNALPDPVWGGGGSQNPKSGNDAQGQASAPTGIPNFMGLPRPSGSRDIARSGWAPNISPWMPSTPPGGYNVDTTQAFGNQASGNQASGNQASGNQAPAYGTPGAPGYQAPQNMGTLGQQYLDAQSFYDMSNQPFQNTTQFIDQGRNVLQGQAGQDARMQNLGFHGATLPGAGAQYGGVDVNKSGAINTNDFILQGQQALRNR